MPQVVSGLLILFVLVTGCSSLRPVSADRPSAGLNRSRMDVIMPKSSDSPEMEEWVSDTDRSKDKEGKKRKDTEKTDEDKGLTEAEGALRSQLITQARSFVGTPYVHGGKTPRGFDCSGLTQYLYNAVNLPLRGSSAIQASQGVRLSSVKDAKPGDLLFFSRNPKGRGGINHVALVVKASADELVVIHSTNSGVIEEDISSSGYWSPRILYARDLVSRSR